MQVGDPVEVHTKYSDTWAQGYDIAELVADGYRVRRLSDGSLLPGYTSEFDVRAPEVKRW